MTRITKTCDYNIGSAQDSNPARAARRLFGAAVENFNCDSALPGRIWVLEMSYYDICEQGRSVYHPALVARPTPDSNFTAEDASPASRNVGDSCGIRALASAATGSCWPHPLGLSVKSFGCTRVPPRCPPLRSFPPRDLCLAAPPQASSLWCARELSAVLPAKVRYPHPQEAPYSRSAGVKPAQVRRNC